MELTVRNQSITDVACDALVVNLFEDVTSPGGATGAVDKALGGMIAEAVAAGDIRGKLAETHLFYTGGRLPARKVVVVGLGDPTRLDYRRVRHAAAAAARAARRSGARSVATIVHGAGIGGLEARRAAQFTVDGTYHGLWRFGGYKTGDRHERPSVTQLILAEFAADKIPAIEAGARDGQIIAESANWGRQIGMMPGNKLTAATLAEMAAQMASEVGLECECHDREGCRRLGLGLLLAVNQGSVEEPRLIVLRHRGGAPDAPWLGMVGKGLTFDTGGISIKGQEGMWDMKFDMLGGAAVLGAMRAAALLGVRANLLAVVPATDNMPDGGAYKPGDVIAGLSGKTVEVRSTDAEGRLILADGLAYAIRQGASHLLTASTLTGGARIVAGDVRYLTVANDDAWERELLAAAEEAGEKAWPLPHDEEYHEYLKSNVADMINSVPGKASTVAGGIFLLKHVGKTPTVHMDIAATAYAQESSDLQEKGATGAAVRTLVRAAQRWAERD
jgi:leucyl aminopeptidase